MGEKTKPSTLLVVVTFIPLFLNAGIFVITEGFNVNPHSSPLLYAIGSLILAAIAVLAAIIGLTMARDEEPEWGSKLPFKVIEGVNIFSILLSVMFALLVLLVYFLKGA